MNLPSIRECIVLFIIRENYGCSGYRIRRIYTQSTGKEISLGTLIPLLRRFEWNGLIVKETTPTEKNSTAFNWHLTEKGNKELDNLLNLLDKLLPRKGTEESLIAGGIPISYTVTEGNEVR